MLLPPIQPLIAKPFFPDSLILALFSGAFAWSQVQCSTTKKTMTFWRLPVNGKCGEKAPRLWITPGHPDAIVEHKFGSQFSIIRLGAEYKKRSIYDRDFHADTRED